MISHIMKLILVRTGMIRPLKKISRGYYISNNDKWKLICYNSSWHNRSYNCHKIELGQFDSEKCFYEDYPTLKSLIKAIEDVESTSNKST